MGAAASREEQRQRQDSQSGQYTLNHGPQSIHRPGLRTGASGSRAGHVRGLPSGARPEAPERVSKAPTGAGRRAPSAGLVPERGGAGFRAPGRLLRRGASGLRAPEPGLPERASKAPTGAGAGLRAPGRFLGRLPSAGVRLPSGAVRGSEPPGVRRQLLWPLERQLFWPVRIVLNRYQQQHSILWVVWAALRAVQSGVGLWENTTKEEVLKRARTEIWQSWRRACAENADHPRAAELFDRHTLPAFHDPFAGGWPWSAQSPSTGVPGSAARSMRKQTSRKAGARCLKMLRETIKVAIGARDDGRGRGPTCCNVSGCG